MGGRQNAIIWAPQHRSDGSPAPWHWRTLREVAPGDLIFHYTNQRVVGMSRAIAPAYDSDYPYDEESDWAGVGWQVPVEYAPLDRPIPRDAIPLEIRIANHTSDNGPFNKNGDPAQGYFFEVSKALALTLMELIGFDPAQDDVVIEQPPGN